MLSVILATAMACTREHVEVAVIVAVIAVVWGLMSLPVIFYYRPLSLPDSGNNSVKLYSVKLYLLRHADRVLNCTACVYNTT